MGAGASGGNRLGEFFEEVGGDQGGLGEALGGVVAGEAMLMDGEAGCFEGGKSLREVGGEQARQDVATACGGEAWVSGGVDEKSGFVDDERTSAFENQDTGRGVFALGLCPVGRGFTRGGLSLGLDFGSGRVGQLGEFAGVGREDHRACLAGGPIVDPGEASQRAGIEHEGLGLAKAKSHELFLRAARGQPRPGGDDVRCLDRVEKLGRGCGVEISSPVGCQWDRHRTRAESRHRLLNGRGDSDGDQARPAAKGSEGSESGRADHARRATDNENTSKVALVRIKASGRERGHVGDKVAGHGVVSPATCPRRLIMAAA